MTRWWLLLVSLAAMTCACGGADEGTIAAGCTEASDCKASQFCSEGGTCVSSVVEVAAGARHTCALHADGTVSCWGLGESIDGSGLWAASPRLVASVGCGTALAAGQHGSCALTQDGEVRCWGISTGAVLQEGGATLRSSGPLTLGLDFGCASAADGVYCWGQNRRGQLGRPLELTESVAAVRASGTSARLLGAGETVLAVGAEGDTAQLCGWGDNASKLLSDAEPVSLYTTPQCAPAPDVTELAVGSVHACARNTVGELRCWGERYYGQLGIGGDEEETADVAAPGFPALLPAPVERVVAGASHTCVLLTDGTVECFGLDDLGQSGGNAPIGGDRVLTPAPIAGLSRPVVGLGSGPSAQHTCAILDDGSVECWGSNDAGQLGGPVSEVRAGRFAAQPLRVSFAGSAGAQPTVACDNVIER